MKQIETSETRTLRNRGLRGTFAPEREGVTAERGKFCNEEFHDLFVKYC